MPGQRLSLEERVAIEVGLAADGALRAIAAGIARPPSTVSRGVAAGGGRARYSAVAAQARAVGQPCRPKVPKLVADKALGEMVDAELAAGFSPAGCAARLRREGLSVCHETIYRAVYARGAGGLAALPEACLRARRRRRRPRSTERTKPQPLGHMRPIAERPPPAAHQEEPAGLPGGLATQLGRSFDKGIEPSPGQWQKLALGRAMLRDEPLLMVLDEPTASLDPGTEAALSERYAGAAVRTARRTGAITVLVSHRFSTVRMADLIVVVSGGRVTEVGPHEVLVEAAGTYAELYALQARGYR